ncbi:DUF1285 domain-containing protein [Sandaracinobacter sp. RS1-74]|uniref:DUF1285 domain-containing protein n=1 Tax=Sandaracinobacteroides sayramensis TaxID=2913411 RepID=UPI001ED9FDBD|nr:DUF1285 domain-containing protein [Sandaracinobacteroides sayramensis]MCG2841517.1 DUF1285 domain-containing protein [Sandaracinobacteroides sayramensis]
MAAPVDTIRPEALDLSQASLADIARAVAEKRLPPVEQWNPGHCGDSEMRIRADGTWFHQGTPIGRAALVKLFSNILRREADGGYVLVTPVEKLSIEVEDAPFLAVEATSEGEGRSRTLAFRLNTDEIVIAGPANPLRLETAADGTPRPYLHVRGTRDRPLEALVNRPVFYQLADLALAEQESGGPLGLWSGGAYFAFAD